MLRYRTREPWIDEIAITVALVTVLGIITGILAYHGLWGFWLTGTVALCIAVGQIVFYMTYAVLTRVWKRK